MNNTLHIVCLDAPSPPDYGGAIDMFYKIPALHAAGKKIILHYFSYRQHRNAAGLESYCEEIHTYDRKSFFSSPSLHLPYIVRSRINHKLIGRLNADQHPILLEGIHCAGLLPHLKKPERVVLRMHNEEASYYKGLSQSSPGFFKKLYYSYEAFLLKKIYQRLPPGLKLACLSSADKKKIEEQHKLKAELVPCFIPWQKITARTGKGDYCLYHGNMKVAENEAAALWLVENVFAKLSIPFAIAGQGVSQKLQTACSRYSRIRVINDPPADELDRLISDAHIHVLPSLNTTGVKLKLLHAFFDGRFCITNANGVDGSGLEAMVEITEDEAAFRQKITELYQQDFTEAHIKNRQAMLSVYNNITNAQKLSALW